MDIFSVRLKWLRERKKLSQKEIAELVGMSPQGYGKIENAQREPKLEVLAKLPRILGESTDFLLGVTNKTKELDRQYSYLEVYKNSVEFAQDMLSGKRGDKFDESILKNYEFNLNHYSKKMKETQEIIKQLEDEIPK